MKRQLLILATMCAGLCLTGDNFAQAATVPPVQQDGHGKDTPKDPTDPSLRTEQQLGGSMLFEALYQKALTVLRDPRRLEHPTFLAGHIWDFWQDAGHPRGIWRQTTLASFRTQLPGWRTKLDLDRLSKDEHRDWVFHGAICLQPKERYCLIELSEKGREDRTLREYDTQAGLFISNGFTFYGKNLSVAWVDRDTLLVSQNEETSKKDNENSVSVVRRIIRNQNFSQALEIARAQSAGSMFHPLNVVDSDGQSLLLLQKSLPENATKFGLLDGMDTAFHGDGSGHVKWLDLPERIDFVGMMRGQLVFSLHQDWFSPDGGRVRTGSLISVDPESKDKIISILFSAGEKEDILETSVIHDGIVAVFRHDGDTHAVLFLASPTEHVTWTHRDIPLPKQEAIHIAASDVASGQFLLETEGFLDPPHIWLMQPDMAQPFVIRQSPPLFESTSLTVEHFTTASADGLQSPYFLVHPVGMKKDEKNPVILMTSGDVGSLQPSAYDSVMGSLWLERGGVLAVADIGKDGHEVERFASVGRDLSARHITTAAHLGIKGRPTEGLLMSQAFVRYPSLWNAVVMNMSSPDKTDTKHSEYDTIFDGMKEGVHYPEPFIVSSLLDDATNPVGVRSLVAHLNALSLPFFYDNGSRNEESDTNDAEKTAREQALETVYLMQRLAETH
ncbi:hypothetical protein [Acetobacter estunensis]|uniref:hypothetical protein n=1 Tax=Acetobacter estunensis TaxID=104097 RepID=UPI001C2D29C6|nr:hypothetical protein [Acetobacter estunensis]MBV1837161.1 hypothetical protein [Acetobacter estunensis]